MDLVHLRNIKMTTELTYDTVERTHRIKVRKLAKSGDAVLRTLTPEKIDLWHAVTGIVTEAGELMDAVKKHMIYNQPLDLGNFEEELGDLEFYMEQARQNVGITRQTVLHGNNEKLAVRYADYEYTDDAAATRDDKNAAPQ
jgi:hypothetical protein